MTIAEQLKLLAGALKPWAESHRGRTFIAADPLDAIDQLRARPGTPTAAVLFTGREPRGPYDYLGRNDNQFKIIVSRGRSLRLVPGESGSEGAEGGPPLFDLVEHAENVALSVRLEPEYGMGADELIPVYRGTGPFEVAGLVMDAYEIRIAIAAQAPVQSPDL